MSCRTSAHESGVIAVSSSKTSLTAPCFSGTKSGLAMLEMHLEGLLRDQVQGSTNAVESRQSHPVQVIARDGPDEMRWRQICSKVRCVRPLFVLDKPHVGGYFVLLKDAKIGSRQAPEWKATKAKGSRLSSSHRREVSGLVQYVPEKLLRLFMMLEVHTHTGG